MPTVAQHHVRRARHAGTAARVGGPERCAPVVLMVSGGADSTALLLMACTSTLDIDDGRGRARIARERLHVLHVNHHLRGAASDGDEAFVRELCERYGLPLCVEHVSFADIGGGNLEAAARDARYAAARRYVRQLCRESGAPRSAARILTAHTASDRAETFFMNAIKGSGPAGLSSIPRRRNIIVRPLIDSTHAELVSYLELAGQPWREDESNRDTSYLRNFIRHRILPLARERNGSVERSIGAACDILGDEDAFMSQLASKALRSCIRRREEHLLVLDAGKLASAEIAIARRMVRSAVDMLDADARLEMRHVEAVLEIVAEGCGSRTLPGGLDARVEFGALALRTAAAREELAAGWLVLPGSLPAANGCIVRGRLVRIPRDADAPAMAREVSAASRGSAAGSQPTAVMVDAEALGYAIRDLEPLVDAESVAPTPASLAASRAPRLWMDAPQAGDIMCPLGMHGRTKKLSDILGSEQIPVAERGLVPVLRTAPGGTVVWAAGVRVDERFKCTASTRVGLLLELDRVV